MSISSTSIYTSKSLISSLSSSHSSSPHRAAINAVVDLGGPFLWFSCNDSYAPIPCGSAKGIGCNLPPRPGCTNDTCGTSPYNPFLDVLVSQGYALDTFYPKSGAALPDYSFSCMDKEYLAGLAARATGMLCLAKTQISLHKQASAKLKVADTFSLCLPSSGAGKLAIGIKPKLVKSTPLIVNPVSTYPIYTIGDASDEDFIGDRSSQFEGFLLLD